MSEKEPVAVSEKKQVVVSEKKPVAVSEKKPVAVSEKEPVVVSEKKPVAVSEKEPVAVSEKKPVAVSEKEPVAVSEKKQVELSSKVDEAKDIKNFDDIYDEMSRDEQAVIDYMRSVLTDPSIGSDGNYYHFDDDTLEDLLADFGIEKLQKICSVLKVIIEADRLIDQIKNKDLKEEAKIRFNVRKNDYSRHLKEKVFSMKDIKLIYSAFLYPSAEPSFSYPIVEVKREAACVLTAEKKYSALSSDDKAIIDYLAFSKACLYKDEPPRSLYTFYSFYVNLGKLDSAQFDNFMRDSRFKVLEGGTIDDVRNKTFKCSFNVQV
ncbi:BTA121 domain-containing protein surface lipoprotein [Borrelia anserina]|uniref:Uncharacterized protein n=1 Tax=Borrelia anserina BA2 TaxID=1313293 RepID=W5SQ71_BORAN|nr:hypothetical protein [Borrelia anserina]AHH09022.1 hypothetical protein BAN_0005600 [Borrelia anserina BA2]